MTKYFTIDKKLHVFKELKISNKFPFPYTPEKFTKKETEILLNFFTNVDKPVFAIYNLPQEVVGAMFSRYSRSDKSVRRLFLDEFWDFSFASYKVNQKQIAKANSRTSEFYKKVYAEYGDDSVIQIGSVHIAFEFISQIAGRVIEDQRIGASYIEKSTRYVNFGNKINNHYLYTDVPEIVNSKYKKDFKDWNNFAFESYNKHLETATKYLGDKYPFEKFADLTKIKDPEEIERTKRAYTRALRAKAFDTIRVFLPTTVVTNLGAHYSGQSAENTINKMLISNHSEVRTLGKMAYEELIKISPNFLQNINFDFGRMARNYRKEIKSLQLKVTEKYLKAIALDDDSQDVRLVSYDSDALLKIASQILYTNQSKSYLSKKQIIDFLKKNKKVLIKIIFESIPDRSKPEYNRRHKLPRAFEHAFAEVEFFKDFGIFRDLQRNRMSSTERVYLSPKELSVPIEFYDKGMEEVLSDYLKLHKMTNDLYRKIIKEKDLGLKASSEYVTILGHKLRFNIKANIRQWVFFAELRTIAGGHPSYRTAMQKAVREISKKLPELLPLFAKVDWVEDYGLGRMKSEIYTQQMLEKIKNGKS